MLRITQFRKEMFQENFQNSILLGFKIKYLRYEEKARNSFKYYEIASGVDLRLKSTPNDRFFEKHSMAILFTLRVFAGNLLRGNHRRNTFCISFLMTDLGYEPYEL